MLSLTECVRDFQNNTLWDTLWRALLVGVSGTSYPALPVPLLVPLNLPDLETEHSDLLSGYPNKPTENHKIYIVLVCSVHQLYVLLAVCD